jgi:hypothetical protein
MLWDSVRIWAGQGSKPTKSLKKAGAIDRNPVQSTAIERNQRKAHSLPLRSPPRARIWAVVPFQVAGFPWIASAAPGRLCEKFMDCDSLLPGATHYYPAWLLPGWDAPAYRSRNGIFRSDAPAFRPSRGVRGAMCHPEPGLPPSPTPALSKNQRPLCSAAGHFEPVNHVPECQFEYIEV